MNEKICRLCLQTITTNYQTIEETLQNTLKLNIDMCKEVVKCIECANNLKVFFNFQSSVYPKNNSLLTDLKDDMHLDSENIDKPNNLISFVESESEIRCCFCSKTTAGKCLISLNESKEHMFLVDVLREHIPKLNLNTTDDLLTCEDCLDGLQGVLSFVMKRMDVEQKIRNYIEINGTDANGQIELKDVQQFIFKPKIKSKDESGSVNELGERFEHFQDGYIMHSEAEIKFEKEIDNPDLFIKTEEIDIKSEQSDCNSMEDNESLCILDVTSQKRHEICVNQQETYINSAEITMYMCELCPYEATQKNNLIQHQLTHKRITEVTFKCEICPYEAKRKKNLKQHQLTHKSTLEVATFGCDLCPYMAKRMQNLKRHKLIHKSISDTMFTCELCSYETNRKDSLTKHELVHKSTLELTMFKCDQCPYETKRKGHLKQHKLTHKNTSELIMYKCELCPYETKLNDYLRRHKLIHKSSSELTMYKCDLCTFVTKRTDNLKQHKLTHKSILEMEMFKCDLCLYKTKHKQNLKRHKLTHKRM